MGFSGGAQTRYKKYPCKGSCKRKSYETICENIVSQYQTLVSSLPRETTFRHGRPKAHFMTGPHRQPSNYVKETKTVLGSEFPIVDSRLQALDTRCRIFCHWKLVSGIQLLVGFRFSWAVFRIPKLIRFQTPQAKISLDSGIRISLHETIIKLIRNVKKNALAYRIYCRLNE